MEKWLRIKDIENEGVISIVDIASLVNKRKVIAYDKRTEKPIDWTTYERQAQDIKEFYRTSNGRRRFATKSNATWVPFEGLCELVFDWTEHERHRETEYEECFNYELQLDITHDQQFLIQMGWNLEYTKEIINKYAIFKQGELTKALSEQEKVKTLNITETERSNLLRIIGALVEIHYLQKGQTYLQGENKPNISAIMKHVHENLKKLKIDKNGLGERTLRGKIQEATEIIKESKN